MVIAGSADQEVVADEPAQDIIPPESVEHIVPAGANECVVSCGTTTRGDGEGKDVCRAEGTLVGCEDPDIDRADITGLGGTIKCTRHRIEAEPRGQRAPIGQRCTVSQHIAHILVCKGIRRDHNAERRALGALLIRQWHSHDRRFIDILHREGEHIGGHEVPRVRRRHAQIEIAHLGVIWCATERAGGGIETEPARERAPIGQCRAVGQYIARILVRKGIRRHLNVERHILLHRLIRQRRRHRRGVIDILNRERERIGGVEAAQIRGLHREIEIADITVQRSPAECARRRVEAQPGGKRGPAGQRGAVRELVPRIDVGEGPSRHHQVERRIFCCLLIRQRRSHDRSFVDVLHRERKDIGDREIPRIRGDYTQIETAQLRIIGGAGERTSCSIEVEPRRERAPIGQARAIGQHIVRILIGKSRGRHNETEGGILWHGLIRERVHHRRRMVGRTTQPKDRRELCPTPIGEGQCLHHQRAIHTG